MEWLVWIALAFVCFRLGHDHGYECGWKGDYLTAIDKEEKNNPTDSRELIWRGKSF